MSEAEQIRYDVSLRAVLNAAAVDLLVVDADGRITFANQRMADLVGWTVDQLTGSDIDEMIHPHSHREQAPSDPCVLRSAATADGPSSRDTDHLLRADGSLVPVRWEAVPVGTPEAEGSEQYAVVSFFDAEEREAQAVADAASLAQQGAALWTAQQTASDLGWIAELTRVMSSTLDEDEALRRLARLLTPRLADVVLVDMIDNDGRWRRLGGSVAEGVDIDLPQLLRREDVQHGENDRETRRVAGVQAVTNLDAAAMADPAVLSAPSRTLLAALGARTMLVIPLSARSRTVGVAGLIRLSDNAYSDDDAMLAADIGRRAGLVLANARLYHDQQRTAEDLQRALLPTVRDRDHMQVAAAYLPAADQLRIGGDWYDVFTCPGTVDAHVLVIGDVAGHDLPAATTMAALRNLVRGVAVGRTNGPADVLSVVDGAMLPMQITGTATIIVLRANRHDDHWSLSWSNAGHPPALVIEPGSETAELLVAAPERLLGTRTDSHRSEHVRRVPFGTRLVLYTDGLVERRGEELEYGLARLRQAAIAPVDSAADLLTSLLERIPRSLDDDTAVLVAQLD